MIMSALICVLFFTLLGCEKNTLKEEPNYYLGTWKLMSVNFAWPTDSDSPVLPIFDFSKRDIMYNFYIDSYMYVSGEMGEPDFDSNIEQDCWDLYLLHGIGTGGYKYIAKITSETSDWENGWCWWSLKIGDKDYGLTVSKEKSQMKIIQVFPYNELPWINMRTSSLPTAMFEVHFEKVE